MIRSQSGAARYAQKRALGIDPTRADGSVADPRTDAQAKAFEDWVANKLGLPPDDRLLARGRERPPFLIVENGLPMTLKPYLILNPDGHYLIVEPDNIKRHADAYVVGKRCKRGGPYKLYGWVRHSQLTAKPRVNFGYGPKLAAHVNDLEPIDTLLGLLQPALL